MVSVRCASRLGGSERCHTETVGNNDEPRLAQRRTIRDGVAKPSPCPQAFRSDVTASMQLGR
jgi:hypothetical protein